MTYPETAILACCIEARQDPLNTHLNDIKDAIRKASGTAYQFYPLTTVGGAGTYNGLLKDILPYELETTLGKMRISIDLGAKAVFIAVHGSSAHSSKGCGGYIKGGYADEYTTPERSREFSHAELKRAAENLRNHGIEVPIRAFYITFGEEGENLAEEVPLEEVVLA